MTQFVLPFLFLHLVKLWLCHTITCPERWLVFISISLSLTLYVCICMHVYMCVYICQKDLIFIFSLCYHSWIDYIPTQNCRFSLFLKLRKNISLYYSLLILKCTQTSSPRICEHQSTVLRASGE